MVLPELDLTDQLPGILPILLVITESRCLSLVHYTTDNAKQTFKIPNDWIKRKMVDQQKNEVSSD